MSAPGRRGLVPANDNGRRKLPLCAVLDMPEPLPIQLVEVEVFAELLDALPPAANDNNEGGT
jgi:hypothetical protein